MGNKEDGFLDGIPGENPGDNGLDYDSIEVTDPGENPEQDDTSGPNLIVEPAEEENFDSKVSRLFKSLDELNEGLKYLMATPDIRGEISDKPKYLNQDQIDFLNSIILSPIRNNSFFEILATKAALEKAIFIIFEEMDDESD